MSFEVAAEAYDRYMGGWSRLLAPQFVEFAGVRAGQRVVDVGSGPGALTAELVGRLGAEAVAAVEPSEPFVAAVRSRNPGVDVRQAKAEVLPFADATFDAALAQLVVHFMADPVTGLREMARVTRVDGVVAASVWDYAGGRGPLGPFWEAAQEVVPTAVDEAGLPGAREGDLSRFLEAAGLRNVAERALPASREYADFDAWWEPFTLGVGPAGGWLKRLPPEQQADVRERCRTALPAGPFALTAHAWAARGVV